MDSEERNSGIKLVQASAAVVEPRRVDGEEGCCDRWSGARFVVMAKRDKSIGHSDAIGYAGIHADHRDSVTRAAVRYLAEVDANGAQ